MHMELLQPAHNRKQKEDEEKSARGESRTAHLSSSFWLGCIDERALESSRKGLVQRKRPQKGVDDIEGEEERSSGDRVTLDVAEIEYHAF